MPRLSAIIIAKNEAANIGACLDSVAFCDERIVVDGGSTDDTAEIARQKGVRVATHEWHGFGEQKNFALSLAQGEWILSIDADERVSPALAIAIMTAIAGGTFAGYEIPRLSTFCGREMRHSGWYPDHVLRLFRRDCARFSNDLVHERVICEGIVGRLEEPLRHSPVARLEDAVSRMDRYSTAGADMLVGAGRRVSFAAGLGHGLWTFVRSYLLRGGFLDGREGFLLAVANAEGTYYRYMKAWLASRAVATVSKSEHVSVVVTTYNRADALDAVLRGLAHQTDRNFEIIVADDGSGPETAQLVKTWSSRLEVPIRHVWHEHRGFRTGEIRNRGIRDSVGRICIFLDGDCIPRADFVSRHRWLAEPGWFVTGNRILLSQELTEFALAKEVPIESWRLSALIAQRLRGGINRIAPALRLALGPLRRLRRNAWEGAQSCNLAVARADLDRVDGFDAIFSGWGLEDSDLVVRLLHAGVRRKDGRFATDVLHLWHPPNDRSRLEANRAILHEAMRGTRIRASRGMSSLGAELKHVAAGATEPHEIKQLKAISNAERFRARLMLLADWLAVGVFVSLPWSTSVASILIAAWLLALLPTLDVATIRREVETAAGGLPVLLWCLAGIGLLWADVTWAERLEGFGSFQRLLVIPLLLAQFRRSEHGIWALYGFLVSATSLLLVSWFLVLAPGLGWRGKELGVPVRDYIFQSTAFLLCAFALIGAAWGRARARGWRSAWPLTALAALFLANMAFVASSRIDLAIAPVLAALLGYRQLGWTGAVACCLVSGIIGTALWFSSPYLHNRAMQSLNEVESYRAVNDVNSTALHVGFLKESMTIVATAPFIGHGTGSIVEQLHRAVVGNQGATSIASDNPHNQTFAVAIQLGLVGAVVLLAMWTAHFWLFREVGLTAWIGTAIVVQNVISSLVSSHLFDFAHGWLYIFGVGVAGGMVLRRKSTALPQRSVAER